MISNQWRHLGVENEHLSNFEQDENASNEYQLTLTIILNIV